MYHFIYSMQIFPHIVALGCFSLKYKNEIPTKEKKQSKKTNKKHNPNPEVVI